MSVEGAFLKGNQLRLLVCIWQSSFPFYAHVPTTYNLKDYYVAIDLGSKGSLRDATTVIGPLVTSKDQERYGEFVPTWERKRMFLQQDGQLFKINCDHAQTNWVRYRLCLEKGRAIWLEDGKVAALPVAQKFFFDGPRQNRFR